MTAVHRTSSAPPRPFGSRPRQRQKSNAGRGVTFSQPQDGARIPPDVPAASMDTARFATPRRFSPESSLPFPLCGFPSLFHSGITLSRDQIKVPETLKRCWQSHPQPVPENRGVDVSEVDRVLQVAIIEIKE